MTKEEKIIATAFTGITFIDGSDMGLLYEYMEKKVGHGVIDLMLADKSFWEELHKACEKDFIDMISKEQPSLPNDLDETAEKWCEENNKGIALCDDKKSHYLADGMDAFKAGAEWMAQQGVKAHCIESSNPMSENPNQRLHLINLLYEENENTPYVVAGDDVELTLRKR